MENVKDALRKMLVEAEMELKTVNEEVEHCKNEIKRLEEGLK